MEMISIPRKSINKERKEEDKVIPQKNKNINEKIFTVIYPDLFHIQQNRK
jgi:hypothetical protein